MLMPFWYKNIFKLWAFIIQASSGPSFKWMGPSETVHKDSSYKFYIKVDKIV